ncbi:hypothetical protein BT96DRAFT_943199 [Gymnopus androsaceus JB14]|uniref:Uncharacterized protein n=1 Tax=Gymnopus androsaceus JB14 TaxID=1447944 RepID=A0A6A4H9S2_9AGAR|nr:hypothetical protein BT96DRAFT_943199 [Gymnopus androsaceus JB14]
MPGALPESSPKIVNAHVKHINFLSETILNYVFKTEHCDVTKPLIIGILTVTTLAIIWYWAFGLFEENMLDVSEEMKVLPKEINALRTKIDLLRQGRDEIKAKQMYTVYKEIDALQTEINLLRNEQDKMKAMMLASG